MRFLCVCFTRPQRSASLRRVNNGFHVVFQLSSARRALYVSETCLIAGTLLCRHFINDAATKHQIEPQLYPWWTSVCILIINELVNKMEGYLTGPTPSSSSVYIMGNIQSFCCFDWSLEVFVSENHVRIGRKLLLRRAFFPSRLHISFFFYCVKSVEKMKQPDGPRAIRTVRVRAFVFLSDPKQSPVLTQAAAGISRGTKKQISACRSLRCATASPQWWLNPRSVSGSFVLLLTTCVTV